MHAIVFFCFLGSCDGNRSHLSILILDFLVDQLTANANGFEEEKLPEPEKEVEDEPKETRDGTEQEKAGEAPLEQVQETAENKEVDVKTDETVEPPSDNHLTGDNEQTSVENNCETENAQEPTNYDTKITNDEEIDETQTTTRKIEVPSSKVSEIKSWLE